MVNGVNGTHGPRVTSRVEEEREIGLASVMPLTPKMGDLPVQELGKRTSLVILPSAQVCSYHKYLVCCNYFKTVFILQSITTHAFPFKGHC